MLALWRENPELLVMIILCNGMFVLGGRLIQKEGFVWPSHATQPFLNARFDAANVRVSHR